MSILSAQQDMLRCCYLQQQQQQQQRQRRWYCWLSLWPFSHDSACRRRRRVASAPLALFLCCCDNHGRTCAVTAFNGFLSYSNLGEESRQS